MIALADHRPLYHLHPQAGWMNDPNGAIQWRGTYHLFYQYNPEEAVTRNKHWAHVASEDMNHWRELPIALAPTPGGYDWRGCFSGSCVIDNGVPTILYTGVWPEVQCIATGTDDLTQWTRDPGNPILSAPPEGLKVTGFRDPYVWREDGHWMMGIGGGLRGQGGSVLLYRSTDLRRWEFLQPLFTGSRHESGFTWNCPSFFPLEGRHVLIISGQRVWKPFYYVGDYEAHTFQPTARGLVDYGGDLYATQVFIDERGRCILWGWIWEAQPFETIREQGWAGVMALPRVLSLREDGTLAAHPAPEVECLRRKPVDLGAAARPGMEVTGEILLPGLESGAVEIEIEIDPGSAEQCGVAVFCSPDGEERTLIGYHRKRRCIFIDRSRANLSPTMFNNWRNPACHQVRITRRRKPTRLRIFLDRSVIEVFTGDGACLSSRVYPHSASRGVRLFAENGKARVLALRAWELGL